jgi:membrane dipeptidase
MLVSALGAIAAACAGPSAKQAARREADLMAQGAATIEGSPIFDCHAHPGGFIRSSIGEVPLDTLAEMRTGGVDAAFFSVVADAPVIRRMPDGVRQVREPHPGELRSSAVLQIDRVLARAGQGRLHLVLAPDDVDRARRERRPAALLAFEGGDALEGEPARVREYHALGVRSIQLVHYRINELGDIQTEPPRHGGLTPAGQAVVSELNRLGMVVDGAHAAPATLRGILAASRHPIIVSHTGPAALRPQLARHLADDLLREVAAKGGVIGVWPLARAGAGLDQLLRELDYVRRLVGIDHVGLGTDMAGLAGATSIPTYREVALLPAALLARGLSDAGVRKVLGGNLMRVFETASAGR